MVLAGRAQRSRRRSESGRRDSTRATGQRPSSASVRWWWRRPALLGRGRDRGWRCRSGGERLAADGRSWCWAAGCSSRAGGGGGSCAEPARQRGYGRCRRVAARPHRSVLSGRIAARPGVIRVAAATAPDGSGLPPGSGRGATEGPPAAARDGAGRYQRLGTRRSRGLPDRGLTNLLAVSAHGASCPGPPHAAAGRTAGPRTSASAPVRPGRLVVLTAVAEVCREAVMGGIALSRWPRPAPVGAPRSEPPSRPGLVSPRSRDPACPAVLAPGLMVIAKTGSGGCGPRRARASLSAGGAGRGDGGDARSSRAERAGSSLGAANLIAAPAVARPRCSASWAAVVSPLSTGDAGWIAASPEGRRLAREVGERAARVRWFDVWGWRERRRCSSAPPAAARSPSTRSAGPMAEEVGAIVVAVRCGSSPGWPPPLAVLAARWARETRWSAGGGGRGVG